MNYSDSVNKNLRDQIDLAVKANIHIPEFIKIDTYEQMESALLHPDLIVRENFAFKKTDGVKVGFCAWFNGERFVNFVGVVREDYQFAGNQGKRLDDNIVMIYGMNRDVCINNYKKISKVIKERDPGFKGFVQVNVYLKNDLYWYDYIQFGAQPEIIMNYFNLVDDNIKKFDEPLFFNKRYAASLRIFPLHWQYGFVIPEDEFEFVSDIWDVRYEKRNGFFIASASDNNIKDTWKKIYEKIESIEKFNYFYRIDGSDVCKKNFHYIKKNNLV